MNDSTNKNRLTEKGSLRRKEMLTELQSQLVLNREWQKQKHLLWRLATAAFLIASTVWILNLAADRDQNFAEQKPAGANQFDGQIDDSNPGPPPKFNQVSFETISDDELLRTLSDMGQPCVLGEIGGETKVISQLGPKS